MKLLDIGCGFNKREGAQGIDKNPLTPADVHHDLNVFPYPFDDNTFDDIQIINVLEHLKDIVRVMEEIYRIAKDNARIFISVPHFSGIAHFTDPTHLRGFSSRSFDYFVPGTELFDYRYSSTSKFKKKYCYIGGDKEKPFWKNPVLYWLNKHKDLYEKRFAFWYPQATIIFILEPIKS
ncbi:MAG: methyltransferase domain-containing protein [Elusimicrobia bacterium]|nr:methyltransferase domain-containing protein [Elusimicrobiota bacterium]